MLKETTYETNKKAMKTKNLIETPISPLEVRKKS